MMFRNNYVDIFVVDYQGIEYVVIEFEFFIVY